MVDAANMAANFLGIDHHDVTVELYGRNAIKIGMNYCRGQVYSPCVDHYKIELVKEHPSIIHTIGHEMVHVKQFLDNRLKVFSEYHQFDGKKYSFHYPYYKRPWEIEAHEMDEIIFHQICLNFPEKYLIRLQHDHERLMV